MTRFLLSRIALSALATLGALAAAACGLPDADFAPSVDGQPDGPMGLEVSPGTFELGEGRSAEVTVRATSAITADVTVALGTTGGGLGLEVPTVVLTPAAPMATLSVTALDDPDAQDGAGTVTADAPGLGAASAAVTIDDDEVLAIETDFAQIGISDTTSATVHVSLSAQPTADITVRVAMADTSIATASQMSLVFTAEDWDVPQAVDIVGVHDADTISEATALQLTTDGVLPDRSVVVNVTDVDQLNIVASPSTISVTEEAIGTPFGVYLTREPEAPISITITPMNGAVGVSPTRLDFTPQDYQNPRTVTVTAATDDNVAGFDTSIRLSAPATATQPALTFDVQVAVVDDDVQALLVEAASPFTVVEEASATFTARLAFRPAADTTVTVAPQDGALAAVSPGALSFTTTGYATPQQVIVTARPDDDVAPETTAIRLSHASFGQVDVATTITDNDTLALVIPAPPTVINEGTAAAFMVALNYQPTAPIQIAITSSNPTALAAPMTPLTFTAATYATPQPVTLTAATDGNLADESVTVTLASPGNLTARALPITIDDQTALAIELGATTVAVVEQGPAQTVGVRLSNPPLGTVTVDVATSAADVQALPATLSFGPSDWMTPKNVAISALTDDDVASETATVTLSSGAAPPRTITVNLTDDDTQAILAPGPVNLVEGGTATIGVRLEFRPATAVDVTPSSPTPAVVTVPGTALSFTPSNWSTPQTVTVTGVQDADTNPGTGTIRFTVGTLVTTTTVNVTDDDQQGIVVASAPTVVTEGSNASFTVRLQAMPPSTVTVGVSSNSAALTVVPPGGTLTFTTANWSTPQTVTVAAPVDHNLADEMPTINLTSPGNAPDVNLSVRVDDQDLLQFVLSTTAVNVTEQGAGANVLVSLNKQPLAPVTASHSSGSPLATSSGTLAWSTTDWATPRTLTIAAPSDDDTAGGSATISLSATAITVPASVTASVTDDDTQGLVEDAPATLTTVEDAPAASDVRFRVHLEFRPAGNVAVGVQVLNTAVATLTSPSTLTFTPSNWDVDQTVIVHGASDPNLVDNTTTVRLTGPETIDLPLTVDDDDVQTIVTNPTTIAMTEGTPATMTVRLQYVPTTSPTTVTLSSSNPEVGVPATLSFTTANYAVPQTVTITAAADSDAANDTATITLGNGDAPLPATVPVTVTDPTILTRYGWWTQFASANTINQGTVMAYRVVVPTATTIDKLGLVAAAQGGDFKLAVYDDAGNTPGNLRHQVTARQAISAAGTREVDIVDGSLPAGTYWIAVRVAPSASIGHNASATTELRCLRTVNVNSLDDPWPSPFGAANCGQAGIYNLFLVTYRNP